MQIVGVGRQHLCEISVRSAINFNGIKVKVLNADHPLIPGYTSGSLKKRIGHPSMEPKRLLHGFLFQFLN